MEFIDRKPEHPGRVTLKNVQTGVETVYDVILSEGSTDPAAGYAEGTKLNSQTFQQFKEAIFDEASAYGIQGPQGPRGYTGPVGGAGTGIAFAKHFNSATDVLCATSNVPLTVICTTPNGLSCYNVAAGANILPSSQLIYNGKFKLVAYPQYGYVNKNTVLSLGTVTDTVITQTSGQIVEIGLTDGYHVDFETPTKDLVNGYVVVYKCNE